MYLFRCNKESKSDDKTDDEINDQMDSIIDIEEDSYLMCENDKMDSIIDIQAFKWLSELDTKLGTTASEQLYGCLLHTTRRDIITVRFDDLNIYF